MRMVQLTKQEKENILDHIPEGVTLLPNTSGARNAEEAVRIARLSRAMGCGDFVKVEIMRDTKYLFPDNYETVKATETLAKEGFIVLPYMNPDLNVARDLQSAGAAAVMPLAAPIGSNKGLATKAMIQVLIDEIENAGVDRKKALELLVQEGKIVLMSTHDPLLALMGAKRLVIENGGVKTVIRTSERERENLAALERIDRKMQRLRNQIRLGGAIEYSVAGYFAEGEER